MKSVILFVMVSILGCTSAWAGNPGDVDLFFRLPKAASIKYSNDVNAESVYAAAPVSKNVSVMVYDWHSNGKALKEYGLTVRASKSSMIGVVVDDWDKSTDKVSLMLDVTEKSTSLACLIPVNQPNQPIIGLRQKIGNDLTLYGKFCQNSKPLLGVSYSTQRITVDVAYGDKVSYVRVSKAFRNIIPEARFRFTPNEDYYGYAVCIRFN